MTSVLDKLFQGTVPEKKLTDTREVLAPEVNMDNAKKWSGNMKAVHAELDTLPRCAKHGTVSFWQFFMYCLFFCFFE